MIVYKCFMCIITAALTICACNGQFVDYLLPTLTNSARQLTDGLARLPLLHLGSQVAGDVLTNSVNVLTTIPLEITRAFGVGNGLPSIISGGNIVDLTNNIIADYNLGLGNEDIVLTVDQLIIKYGYPIEHHEVVTEDGYILSMYRIPKNGTVVFLMHGILGSADDYVIAGAESGLAYLLSQEGYDVWLGNARGNKYSRRHVEMTASDAAFWDFSWHEIGYYDLPAMIDYVLITTGLEAIKYIGHSQGTTSFFVMASERPEYNSKISLMVALSPVAFMAKVQSPIVRLLAPVGALLHGFTKSLGIYEFLPDNNLMRTLKQVLCGTGPLAEIICGNVIFFVCGVGFPQLNATNLPVILGHFPSGAAAKQFAHYGQGVVSGAFRRFDYGSIKNLEIYGSQAPPSYALGNIETPVSLFYSDADWLAHLEDVEKLYNELPNVVDAYKVPYEQFNHLDFILAKDFKTAIYERLRKLLLLF